MQLKSFRVYKYRSIVDSKECFLSLSDNITVLAGQNESGKSSLLEALKHYEKVTPCLEAYRDEDDISNPPLVQCTYLVEENDKLHTKILNSDSIEPGLKEILNTGPFRAYFRTLSQFSLLRNIGSSKESVYRVGLQVDPAITKAVNTLKQLEKYKDLLMDDVSDWLGNALFKLTPHIIFFDEDFDLLPDLFYLDDLANDTKIKGLQAVKNIETISGSKFSELPQYTDSQVRKWQKDAESTLTVNFNLKWQQRVGDETGAILSIIYHQGGKDGRPYLRFFIQTREGELLPPEKRSLGFKWFLSFYLHLTAESKNKSNLILLFDEPGPHLHSKAQYDMLKLFEELSQKNQIIYTTHSPYLIDTDKLHRIKLIFNSKEKGTTIEKITTSLSQNQKDAIKPIIDALGLQVAHNFSAAKDRNIIVEGVSDHYYLTAAKRLLGITEEFYFMPAMGASNAHLLMELCIGWGLKWLMIFDEKGTTREVNKIKKNFFPHDNTIDNKIYTIKGCDGIEDIFEESDIKLAEPKFIRTEGSLKEDLDKAGTKELIGRFFSDKVTANEIKWEMLSEKAQNHFRGIFAFIERGFQ